MARRVIAGDYAINGKDCFINDGEQYDLSTASYWTRITGGPPTYDEEKIVDPEQLNAAFHTRFHELDAALQTFSNSLPVLTPEDLSEVVNPTYLASLTPENDIDMTGEELYDLEGGWCPRRSARTHTIITGHSLTLAASMQLHFLLSETRPESHRRVLEDAMRTAELSRITNDVDPRNFQLTVTIALFVAARVLIRELQLALRSPAPRPRATAPSHQHSPATLDAMINALRILMHTYHRLLVFYQLTDSYMSTLLHEVTKLGLTI